MLTLLTSVPSKLLTQVRWESSVPSENLAIPEKKPRKTYKVMRKVNPTEDILSPEQWKHMRVSRRVYFRWLGQRVIEIRKIPLLSTI